jgi:hypothetical protein
VSHCSALLSLILLSAGLLSLLHAITQPFWFDEICTVIVCRQSGASEIWKALDSAADSNPPVFYLIARWTRHQVADDHLGYRLPSILGALGAVSAVYFVLSRRVNRTSALAAATFLLCTPLATYAYEARPYALMLACMSCAILAWQRLDDSLLWTPVLALTLAASLSLHYYAILIWPAFVAAEATTWYFHRRFRWRSWAAFAVGALPLLLFLKLLLKLRQYYGQYFWARPKILQVFLVYNWLFDSGGYWGWIFAVFLTTLFLYWCVREMAIPDWSHHASARYKGLPLEERVLALVLLGLPVIAVAAAKLSHGGMTNRYMLPTLLGAVLALGYLIDKLPRPLRVLLLILFCMNYAFPSLSLVRDAVKGSLVEPAVTATHDVRTILSEHSDPKIPMVVASNLQYLEMVYYLPSDLSRKLYVVTDRRAALAFTGTDSTDVGLWVLRKFFPLQVADYRDFASEHREFLLISEDQRDFNWWPSRLLADGEDLRLVARVGGTSLYKVTLK